MFAVFSQRSESSSFEMHEVEGLGKGQADVVDASTSVLQVIEGPIAEENDVVYSLNELSRAVNFLLMKEEIKSYQYIIIKRNDRFF